MSGMQQFFRTFFTALLLALPMIMPAAQQDDVVRKWIKLSSQQLIDTAWHHTHGHNVTDTTLICLSMVVNRYENGLPKQETEQCIQASMYLWSIYFYLYFDYSKSMEYLVKAQTMAQEASLHIPKIDNAFGALYQTLAEQCHDRSLHVRALHYYTQAFHEALRQRLDEETDNSFGNAIYVAAAIDSMEAVNSEWDSYQRLPVSEKNVLRIYNRLMYNGLRLMAEQKFEEAFKTFGQQFDGLPDTDNYVRHQYVTLTHCAKALESMGRRQEAVDFLLKAEQKALQSGMKDMQLEVYERMACRRLGDIDHYGQLTIEAIASGVGFRSRTSFVTSFKRITGLTPSEYQRLAREEASAAQPG